MSGGGSRGRKREHHEEHEEHVNHEAWVIPYADVLTLLMALFLVLWALGDTNEEKTSIAADSFRRELGGGSSTEFDLGFGDGGSGGGGVSILDGIGPAPLAGTDEPVNDIGGQNDEADIPDDSGILVGLSPDAISPDDPRFDPLDDPSLAPPGEAEDDGSGGGTGGSEGETVDPLDEIERAVREEAVGSGLATAVGFRREARGLVVSIVSDSVLFGEGAAAVQPDGATILGVVAGALLDRPNFIIVEGHTDSRPISTAEFPSNWELSTARATSVLRLLSEELGIENGRLSAAGYADTRPIASADDPTSLARNRRVEIVVIG